MAQAAIVIFDIDGVVRDVGGSYRRALADTVEYLTAGQYRPSAQEIDQLKGEGIWNNDWEASQELVYRYFAGQPSGTAAIATATEAIVQPDPQGRGGIRVDYDRLVGFFQSRYRGTDPVNWNGYIRDEPLLMDKPYLDQLTTAGLAWGFFSGATRGSASYVLERRIGLESPVLVAMEDAPGKPDPTGLFATLAQVSTRFEEVDPAAPVLYVGDTVADMYTVARAREVQGDRRWLAVGVLPPHVQETPERQTAYAASLTQAGADVVLDTVQALTPSAIAQLLATTAPHA